MQAPPACSCTPSHPHSRSRCPPDMNPPGRGRAGPGDERPGRRVRARRRARGRIGACQTWLPGPVAPFPGMNVPAGVFVHADAPQPNTCRPNTNHRRDRAHRSDERPRRRVRARRRTRTRGVGARRARRLGRRLGSGDEVARVRQLARHVPGRRPGSGGARNSKREATVGSSLLAVFNCPQASSTIPPGTSTVTPPETVIPDTATV